MPHPTALLDDGENVAALRLEEGQPLAAETLFHPAQPKQSDNAQTIWNNMDAANACQPVLGTGHGDADACGTFEKLFVWKENQLECVRSVEDRYRR